MQNNYPLPSGGSPSQELLDTSPVRPEESLRDLLRVLRKRSVLILVTALAVFVLALLVCALMPPRYTAVATLLVDKDDSTGLDLGSFSGLASVVGGESDIKTDLQTHAYVLAGDSNILQVVDALKLRKQPAYKYSPRFSDSSKLAGESNLPLDRAPITRDRILKEFSKRLKVVPQADSRLIKISYIDTDPDRAARVANEVVNNYIHHYLESKFKTTADASDWLSDQLNDLKHRVEVSQRELSEYQRRSGLSGVVLGMGVSSNDASGLGTHIPALEKLSSINNELTAAEANRIAKEAIYHLTQTQSPDVIVGLDTSDLVSMGAGSAVTGQGNGLAALEGLRAQEASLKIAFADASTKYGARNPRLDQLQAQIAAVDEQIRLELHRIDLRAKNDFELAKANEAALQREYQNQQDVVSKFNDSANELQILASRASSSRTLYEGLYTKLQEASISSGVRASNLNLVDPARAPATPTSPNWRLYPIAGLGSGLLLGICAAFLWENLDDAVSTPEQVEQLSPYPVLAYVPKFQPEESTGEDGAPRVDGSPMITAPRSSIAEAYRKLRTAMQLSTLSERIQIVLISSPITGDGKSTTCYNLAIAFAQHGERVLIIDADMRKPRMHRMFSVRCSPGVSDVIAGVTSFSNAIHVHPLVPTLQFIAAGTSPPNPAEMLDSAKFQEMLNEARLNYDVILIDSPPILMVTDPIVLTPKVDGTMLVIRSGVTSRQTLNRVLQQLSRISGRKLGIILNSMDTSSVEYYYSYGYYGNSKYYGEEDSRA